MLWQFCLKKDWNKLVYQNVFHSTNRLTNPCSSSSFFRQCSHHLLHNSKWGNYWIKHYLNAHHMSFPHVLLLHHMWYRSKMEILLCSVNQLWRGMIMVIIPSLTQDQNDSISRSSYSQIPMCKPHPSVHWVSISHNITMTDIEKETAGAALR